MELYTLNRKFLRQDVIDGFHSAIWTERYYGDSDVELVVPATTEMIAKLPPGTFLSLDNSERIMIIETVNIEDGKLKVTGISLLQWLNNRFLRLSPLHDDQQGVISGSSAGYLLWKLVFDMCVAGSPYMSGASNMGIPNPGQLVIPGLGLKGYDDTGGPVNNFSLTYGPLYDALRELATTYEVGMSITLESATETSYFLGFRSYRGLDRTTRQSVNPPVRFSPTMDSFTDIKEVQSIAALKTLVYAFMPGLADEDKPLATTPGEARLTGTQYTGFDLRALMVFEQSIPHETIAGNAQVIKDVLNNRAQNELYNHRYIITVDGEIVPMNQFKYGVHYNLGDVIEVQGNSETVQTSRITEYIRSEDESGERAYPTVAMLER